MHEDISELEISVHNLIFDEGSESVEDLNKELDGFLLVEDLFLFQISRQVAFIAILQNEVEVVGSFFDVVELDDVTIVACFKDFYFVLKQLHKLS